MRFQFQYSVSRVHKIVREFADCPVSSETFTNRGHLSVLFWICVNFSKPSSNKKGMVSETKQKSTNPTIAFHNNKSFSEFDFIFHYNLVMNRNSDITQHTHKKYQRTLG